MPILLIGATGRTGSQILLEALKRGHATIALVRNPSSLESLTSPLPADQKSNLTVVKGSPLNTEDVTNAINTALSKSGSGTADKLSKLVVISALNSRRTSESPWAPPHPTDSPPRMMADSIANVIASLKKSSPSQGQKAKIIHVSAIGVGKTTANAPWLLRQLITRTNVRLTYEDHGHVEEELKNGAEVADWVVVRPARLTEGDDGSLPKVWPAEKGSIGMTGKCNRGAVARFALDAAEGDEWDNKDPIILS